ncbi:MAG: hypothetical protein M3R09_03035 [Actinomycetota bacterium]|nr:hypothetical protein [Actinomycetota bacterium]
MLYRSTAFGLAGVGVFGFAIAVTTTHQSVPQQVVSAVVGAGLVAGGTWLWRRPRQFAKVLHERPSLVAACGLLFMTAVAAGSGVAFAPLWFPALVVLAVGAFVVTDGRWWLAYGLLAAGLALAAGFASGENADLLGRDVAGRVWFASSVYMISAAYFGRTYGGLAIRLRRLELVLARERDRIAEVSAAVTVFRALLVQFGRLADDVETAAKRLPVDGGADSLNKVRLARDALTRLDPEREPGLGAMLEDVAAFAAPRGVRWHVSVASGCDAVSLRIAEAIKQIVMRALINVDRHAKDPTEVRIDVRASQRGLRCTVQDDGGGTPPERYGEGSRHSEKRAAAMGGRFFYEQAGAGVRVVVELPLSGQPTLTDAEDHPRQMLSTLVKAQISRILRAVRWAAALGMIAISAFDVPEADPVRNTVLAISAALTAEFFMYRAGMREQRRAHPAWLMGALLVAIAASGLIDQTDRFQTSGWVAAILLEVAWRNGWSQWMLAEMVRIPVVVLTLRTPTAGLPLGLAEQVLFPIVTGVLALAAHALVGRTEQLEQAVGSARERWTTITTAAGAIAARHDVVELLDVALDKLDGLPEHPALAARVQTLSDNLLTRHNALTETCSEVGDLLETVRWTIAVVIAPVPVDFRADDIHYAQPIAYAGAKIERFGSRNALLDCVAKFAEATLQSCPPRPWGSPGLSRLNLRAYQTDPDWIDLIATPIPPGRKRPNITAEAALYAATAGVQIIEGFADGTFHLRIQAAKIV